MALRDGDRLGTYVIQGALGVGAMGEVYRARDTKLNRPVAIKVLLPQVANDPDRLSRFTREAQVLASLNHPHIAQIYGLEELAGVRAIVMELVEGPTLAERLRRGAVPIAQALPMAIDIAEALEAAHERGIVHRDLKPANIKIAAGGGVKVLDFGLAKTVAADDGSGVSESLTPTVQGTAEGMILGTAPYMSPEQARGHAVDKRTDIWSFGCVLYEMLTGRRAYQGATISDTLAAILEREPNWRALPDETTPNIRRVLKRCLEKDASRRLHDIADGRIELEDPSGPTTAGVVRGPRTYIPWLVAAGAVVAAGAALVLPSRPEAPALPELRFEINTPVTSDAFSFAISPDGRQLLYPRRPRASHSCGCARSPERRRNCCPGPRAAAIPSGRPTVARLRSSPMDGSSDSIFPADSRGPSLTRRAAVAGLGARMGSSCSRPPQPVRCFEWRRRAGR